MYLEDFTEVGRAISTAEIVEESKWNKILSEVVYVLSYKDVPKGKSPSFKQFMRKRGHDKQPNDEYLPADYTRDVKKHGKKVTMAESAVEAALDKETEESKERTTAADAGWGANMSIADLQEYKRKKMERGES